MRNWTVLATTLYAVAASTTCLADSAGSTPAPPAHLDHIVLGVADLNRATDLFAELTGVRPVYGGKHPVGTHNALVSLGDRLYLELITVQPGAKAPAGTPDFSKLEHPTPIGWAVSADDGEALRRRLDEAGFQVTAPQPGSRTTPAGTVLRWQTFGLTQEFDGAPFFILWAPGVDHPSATSPSGCTLERLEISGPEAETAERFQRTLALAVAFESGHDAAMTVILSCPQGTVVFSPSEATIQNQGS